MAATTETQARCVTETVSALSPEEILALAGIFSALANIYPLSYMRPLSTEVAAAYFENVLASPTSKRLIVARASATDPAIVGTVTLSLAYQENAQHRADVVKLMVHPDYQRRGIGALLMAAMEDVARREGRTLLILDTATGGAAVSFYQRLGWHEVGSIPNYSRSPDGKKFQATHIFYKELSSAVAS
ncbi:hypothetical protein HDU87_002294 [Geranomyces variabilis]|uniref:N-acetyltransferase domain-containing protein n=1 Tax=Geranomyces variabilis TaxID=109894 RepID=A0AAD5TMC6_9FUNG|nr:hypothetical protein HDU87_002294 [Geranomyces variabilis]